MQEPVAAASPLRQSVTQVQYQRWKVAEDHRTLGDTERGNNADFKRAHEAQIERHVAHARENKAKSIDQLEQTREVCSCSLACSACARRAPLPTSNPTASHHDPPLRRAEHRDEPSAEA